MIVNDAATHAELTALYPRYEKALIENDVATLTEMFWDSDYVVRFGAGENLHGTAEIEAFRKARPSVGLGRTVTRLDVTTFGSDFGSVMLEFERGSGDALVRGRQSQTWVRFADGWKIVAAHVSMLR